MLLATDQAQVQGPIFWVFIIPAVPLRQSLVDQLPVTANDSTSA